MALSTVYDVNVKYLVDDKQATKGINQIGKSAHQTSKRMGILSAGLRSIMAMGAGYLGFRKAKEALIDFNAELEQSKMSMNALLMQNMGGTWAINQERANRLVRQFQKDAAVSVGTTKDYVEMAKMITGPLAKAGATMEDIRKVTQAASVAAEVYGIRADVAGRDVMQMMMGSTKSVDQFARMLGVVPAEWNKMVRDKGPQQALKEMLNLFNQPALQAATKAYGKSWAGITSTLEDNLQRAFGKVGLPLMQRITKEIEKLNRWFDENPQRLNQIIQSMADGFVKAFEMAKGIFGFIADHKRTLIMLAKAMLITKGVGMIGSVFGNMGASFMGLASALQSTTGPVTGFGARIGAVAGKLGPLASVLGGVYVAANAFVGMIEDAQERKITRQESRADMDRRYLEAFAGREGTEQVRKAARARAGRLGFLNEQQFFARQLVARGEAAGVIEGGKVVGTQIQIEKAFGMLDKSFAGLADHLIRALEVDSQIRINEDKLFFSHLEALWARKLSEQKGSITDALAAIWAGMAAPPGEKPTTQQKRETNININRIEVAADDPDRFAFAAIGAFQDAAKNPIQSRYVPRGG